jgi:hypothetical protein
LRDGSNTRSTFRLSALITPIHANIVGDLFNDEDRRLHRGLPFRRLLFGFGQRGDLGPGVFEPDELATVRQRNRIVERPVPV